MRSGLEIPAAQIGVRDNTRVCCRRINCYRVIKV